MKLFLLWLGIALVPGMLLSQTLSSQQVGGSGNVFTAANPYMNIVSTLPAIGNQGGMVALIYRQNPNICGGGPVENGLFRYSISKDGGSTWNLGTSACLGIGPINPAYTHNGRYPSLALASPVGATAGPADVQLVYAGPFISSNGSGWGGSVVGLVDSATTSAQVLQETYLFPSAPAGQYFPFSLVERVPGEYWTASFSYDGASFGAEIHLNRGIYDSSLQQINWIEYKTFMPDYYLGFSGDPLYSPGLQIAFSPDGQTGYVGMLTDLVGGQDSTWLPCLAKTTNGGLSWSSFTEIPLSPFYSNGLLDSLAGPMESSPGGGSVSAGGILASCYPNFDLTVDANDQPHMVMLIGNARRHNGDGSYSLPDYSYHPELPMYVVDLTKDSLAGWNILLLDHQLSLEATLGDPNETTIYDGFPYVQCSRSLDGEVIFYHWNDSDTTAVPGNINDRPNLFGAALDINQWQKTPTRSWTAPDPNWAERIFFPHTAPLALQLDSCTYEVALMLPDFPSATYSMLDPVSHVYFQGVSYDRCADFTEPLPFFFNCGFTPFANSAQFVAPDCNQTNGQIWLSPGGGTPPYQYLWSNGSSSDTISGLGAGFYEGMVIDANNCRDTFQVDLENFGAPEITLDSQNISCFGLADGMILLDVSGGTPPYSYAWSNGDQTQDVSGLEPGSYAVSVSDSLGCIGLESANISQPLPIELIVIRTDPVCAEGTGSIDLATIGGMPPYSFLWSNGDTTEDLLDVPANFPYSVVITDSQGCSIDSTFAFTTVQNPLNITSVFTVPNFLCGPIGNGLLGIGAVGGASPIDFSWTGPNSFTGVGDFIFDLTGGVYTVTLTDQNGCTADTSILLETSNGLSIGAIFSEPSCAGFSDGSIALTPAGGIPPYDFLWSDGDTQAVRTNLPVGSYLCQVTDSVGCDQFIQLVLETPLLSSFSPILTPPSCTGFQDGSIQLLGLSAAYTIIWDNGDSIPLQTDLGAGLYSVEVIDSSGCSFLNTFELFDPAPLTTSFLSFLPPCGNIPGGSLIAQVGGGVPPYAYSWSTGDTTADIDGLAAGTYLLTLTDANGCVALDSAQLSGPAPLVATSEIQAPIRCKGEVNGEVVLTGTGGTGSLAFFFDGNSVGISANSLSVDSLSAGTYMWRVTDENSCLDSSTVFLSEPDSALGLSFLLTPDSSGLISAIAQVSGGEPPYAYNWSTSETDSIATGLSQGWYVLHLEDVRGCSLVDSVLISPQSMDELPEKNASLALELFPNPASDRLIVAFYLPEVSPIELTLYDLRGKVLSETEYPAQPLGHQSLSISVEGIASGLYVLQVRTGMMQGQQTFMVE